ncbi:MAG: acetylxylan esterase [Propionibacteriaceae bacterium]
MALFDLPLDLLRDYVPEPTEAPDFDDFWSDTIAEARQHDLAAIFEPYVNRLALIDTFDVTFAGYGGSPIRAWLHVPAGTTEPLPTVVQYHGYSGGRGMAFSSTLFAEAGYAQLVMDTRGQGWAGGGVSGTPDPDVFAGALHSPGFMTAGMDDPRHHYYRRVFTDAVRALEAAAAHPLVDASRIAVTGVSQGGGITIAAAGLAREVGIELVGCAPDVPFLCHVERALELTDAHPYGEIVTFLAGWRDRAATAYRTLSYMDAMNLGRRASAPTLFSVALMDQVCPPSTVFGAYHLYGSIAAPEVSRRIEVYPHNGHEGGGDYQRAVALDWFAEIFG